jgi:hypothetical protein
MPATSTLLDQGHNAIDRELYMLKGFHYLKGSQHVFLHGLPLPYTLVPYQGRANHVGRYGVEIEGGPLPRRDWFLTLQLLPCGSFAMSGNTFHR